ncbi:PleD family two-component system response regulator [Mucilaginibacter sp. UR6-11]|uniref:response regulator n=1 Tax=Mucilaginibacter sp. UR6-11 TaxID=1435644 RepID=UPI001E3C05EE|nr:response regulator [Mucilaginibacter sp. UR6-11]MCC8425666.1 response regulator [Mucilaginibacter sp. UR6-11]
MQRILAVDDDKDILEVLQLILEDSGYEVETLADGEFLFDKIKQQQPDLIILDIMLGNYDGRELCRSVKARKETHNIPVILLSASHALTDCYRERGCPDDFIAKPFDIDVLLNSVQKNLAAA